jgi:predicted enzyme related to lactoylglutathione lyase
VEAAMVEIKGVAHFSIPVSDVDRSIKFYTEVVGCKEPVPEICTGR